MGPNFVLDKGFQATTAIRRFRAVALVATDRCRETNVLGERTWGLCQDEISADDATKGRIADVRLIGISRGIVDAAYPVGTPVRAAADGRLTALAAATANQNQVGWLMAASTAANDQVDVLLTIGSLSGT